MKTHTTLGQRGNTVLGLIIGLVIGLGIAVAVALLITKSSTPFTNKGGKAADAPLPQLQDPNKPLYGSKDAVKEAAKDFVKPADEKKPPEAKAAPAAEPAKNEDDKPVYFLQAGAYKEQADAESARARLALIGVESRINEGTVDNATLYRVRIGPFGQIEAMNRARAKLAENGVEVAVVRTNK